MPTDPLATTLVETYPEWQSYIDLNNDIKTYFQVPLTDTARDVMLQDTLDTACYWVQEYLGRPVAPTRFFRRFTGWTTGAYINLPYYPVLKINNVTEYWGASGPQVLSEQIPTNQNSSGQVYQLDAIHGQVIRAFMGLLGRPWFPGLRNIEIDWVAGFDPIPRPIIMATRELAKYWWVNTQQASRSQPMPRGAEYDDTGNTMLWPAVPNRVTMWLETFTQQGLG